MAISAGSVYSELILDGSKYFSTLEKAEQQMDTFSKKLETAGKSMEKAGKKLSKYVTAPVVGLGAAALKVGMDFQTGMSEVQAISGATGDDLAKLEEKAKEMGATTKFSASEAAEGLKYMAMAGWDTNDMLDGLEGVMMLAAASGEDLALTSDIVTDALTAFGMEAKQAGEFADLLASASSNSNTNVAMLGESFKYVAPLFGALGYSAEDAALALGLMANAGIKGSQAGTSLRAAITRLTKPTGDASRAINELGIKTTDAEGNMLPFRDVIIQLREKFADLTEEQQAQYAATIFGQEAMSGMLAIINASEEDFNNLIEATTNYNGTAKEMADIMQDNLQGQLTMLKSQLEGVGIQLAEILIPIVSKMIDKISEWVDWFANLDDKTQETIVKMAALAAAIGPLLIIIGKLSQGIGGTIEVGKKLIDNWDNIKRVGGILSSGLKATVGLIFSPTGAIIAGITATIAIGVALYKNWDTIKEKAGELRNKVGEAWDNIKTKTSETWENIKTAINEKWKNIKENTSTTLQNIRKNTSDKWEEIRKNTSEKWASIKENISEKARDIKEKIISSITESESEWNSKTADMEATQSRFSNLASKVTDAFGKIAGAIRGAVDAIFDWNRTEPKDKTATYTTVNRTVHEEAPAKPRGASMIRAYARGTNFHPGGLAWVGEQGPELIELPRGTRVYSNKESMAMMNGNNIVNNHFNISEMIIRNDNDIKRVAQELYNLQQKNSRSKGLRLP